MSTMQKFVAGFVLGFCVAFVVLILLGATDVRPH